MKIIKVNLKKRSYDIIVGNNILPLFGSELKKIKAGNCAYVVTNALLKNKYGLILQAALERSGFQVKFELVADSESSKSLESVYKVIADITRFDRKKQLFIIAFGGGVVGDLAGFVASIYKRGIPFIQLPTTLLAQVDSAIGGKTAVDLSAGKNLVGTFYQPKLVFSDTRFLKTLSPKQMRAGLAEVIKYGVIKDPQLFSYLEGNYRKILGLNPESLEFIVSRCSLIKAKIIQQDEREEKGLRTILNFGHTIGHAIEAAGGYKSYNHGEAVALGMLAACGISSRLGLADKRSAERIENLIKKAGLPIKIKKIAFSAIIQAHYRDKKFIGRKNRLVLLQGIGKTRISENIPLEILKAALKERF